MKHAKIYSLGHSNRTLETFIATLKKHRIEIVADVGDAGANESADPPEQLVQLKANERADECAKGAGHENLQRPVHTPPSATLGPKPKA